MTQEWPFNSLLGLSFSGVPLDAKAEPTARSCTHVKWRRRSCAACRRGWITSILALVRCATRQIVDRRSRSVRCVVMRQHVFDCAAARIDPVPEPLHSGGLIEMKLLFEIFSHPRY